MSIVVPCCGMLEYTKLCVTSVLEHSREPFELVFVDVGSLDGTNEYLQGLKAGLAGRIRVEIVRTPRTWASATPARTRWAVRAATMSCCSTTTAS